MNLKLKNTLIITGTLVLGMLIGILICGRFTKVRLDNLKKFYTEKGFRAQFIRVVKPTEKQMRELKPLFKENVTRNRELFREFREKRQEIYEDFRSKAEKILTPEQIQRLDKLEKRHQRMMEYKKMHNRNRPPHGRP
jgi:uncharacterized membrane-anchored protein YhcB (DUF1043 family)